MWPHDADLNIVEVPFESGAIRHRFAVILSDDGTRWIRHGLFVAYSEDGIVVSEGNYVRGQEHGLWRDFHPNGRIAAEGRYENGQEDGVWRFWDEHGNEEAQVTYEKGRERV